MLSYVNAQKNCDIVVVVAFVMRTMMKMMMIIVVMVVVVMMMMIMIGELGALCKASASVRSWCRLHQRVHPAGSTMAATGFLFYFYF